MKSHDESGDTIEDVVFNWRCCIQLYWIEDVKNTKLTLDICNFDYLIF